MPTEVACDTILTGKTWLAEIDPLGQNDRKLKLNMLVNFVGTMHLGLMPIKVFNYNGGIYLGKHNAQNTLLQDSA
jgi:hypothetical protein